MVAVETPESYPPLVEKKPFKEPPAVVTTPCDPWPRPYFLENGLRRVAPYHFTYNTFCKERWRGREILDIFASEFRDRPVEYYVCTDICFVGTTVLTILERCHRAWSCCREWQTCTDYPAHCQKWRCYLAHLAPARTASHRASNRRHTRR